MSEPTDHNINDKVTQPSIGERKFRINATVALMCLGFVGGMLGLSYASVPLYRIFCQVTGYGGTTQKADDYTGRVSEKTITVSFDSNISQDLNWSFKPKVRSIELHFGEKVTAIFLAKNVGSEVSIGEASFNVSPQSAGQYFNKIECFCFTEQTLKPGEMVEMPVLFFIDPDIEYDPLLKNAKIITLSYSFFAKEVDEDAKTTNLGSPSKLSTSLTANLNTGDQTGLPVKLQ
jgi:cytochrome c oxidase assembly protein subunit 11